MQPTSDLATIGTDRLYENGLELNSDNDLTVGYIKCATGGKEEVPIEDTTTEDTTENTEITDGEITEDEVIEEPTTETVDVILSVGSGSFGINISNPLMTQTVLENIYNTYFSNFTFRPCKVNMLGNILLECGDIVTVNNGTNTYTVPIMSIQHSIDGGVVTNIETIAQNETEQEISYTSPTVKLMDRVYYEILEANKAIINDLTANTVTTEYLKANYAQINLANIENGCITNAMIGTEAVKTSQIADGSITDAKIVELTANKIKAGTLDVERLIVTQNNQKYLFHINEDGTTEYQKLNGNILEDRSITADKIVANAITANEIASRTITANKIVSGSITANEIAANTITSAEIKSGTITASKIDVNDLFAQDITATGTIRGINLKGPVIEVEHDIYFLNDSSNFAQLYFGGGSPALQSPNNGTTDYVFQIKSSQCVELLIGTYYGYSIYYGNNSSPRARIVADTIDLSGTTTVQGTLTTSGTIYEGGTALSSLYAYKSHSHSGYASSSHTHSNYVRTDASTTITSAQVTMGTGKASDSNYYYFNNNATGRFNALRYTSLAQISSARRYKENIEYKDNDYWHDALMQVKCCTYNYINGDDKTTKIGVIAEDLDGCMPELVIKNEKGECETVSYVDFIIPLVSEVQRLNKEIDRLENLIKGVQV